MARSFKTQHFDSEGREDNLPLVIKSIKNYCRELSVNGSPYPSKIIFFTGLGEGPMMAYNQLSELELTIIAVTFSATFTVKLKDGRDYTPQIPEKVQKFFKGVEIPVITNRLPFDEMQGVESHNRDMALIKNSIALFGGSAPLAIQAVLQAADAGVVALGEQVIAATGDMAMLVTASTTKQFLQSDSSGLSVNEIICKPRLFTRTRKPRPEPSEKRGGLQIEGHVERNNEKLKSENS